MINTVAIGEYESPKGNYGYPLDYVGEEKMIDERQRLILTNLIFEKIHDEGERESWLSQVSCMTSDDAESAIFSFLTSQWQ
ncbi:MAG: hypothetical protein WAX44_03340 [Minisyncoccia bacterium]